MSGVSSKVFISYTHDSPSHMERVLRLSDYLRSEGVDCNIDQYEESPPEGWPRWMANQVKAADHVLMVCTENYERRFRGHEEVGCGLGASWEGAVITQEIYNSSGPTSKFIPIVLSSSDVVYIPVILQSVTRYCLANYTEDYQRLYRRLTNQPLTPRPSLGSVIPMQPRERVQSFGPIMPTPREGGEAAKEITMGSSGAQAPQDQTHSVVDLDSTQIGGSHLEGGSLSDSDHDLAPLSVAVVPNEHGFTALCLDVGLHRMGRTIQEAIENVRDAVAEHISERGLPTPERAPIITCLAIQSKTHILATAPDAVGLAASRLVQAAYLDDREAFWGLLSAQSQGVWKGIWSQDWDLGDLHLASKMPSTRRFSGCIARVITKMTTAWGPEFGQDGVSLAPTRYDSAYSAKVRIVLGFGDPTIISKPRQVRAIILPMVRENGEWRFDYLSAISPRSLL